MPFNSKSSEVCVTDLTSLDEIVPCLSFSMVWICPVAVEIIEQQQTPIAEHSLVSQIR